MSFASRRLRAIGLGLLAACPFAMGCTSADSATGWSQGNAVGGSQGGGGASSSEGGGGAVPASSGAAASGGQGGATVTATKLGPPYPLVLCHGFFGFEQFAGIDFVTYFYGIKEHLEAQGEIVYTPAVDPFNSSEFRGEQLIAKIEAIVAETGHAKVNLLGHSQGGLDVRYVAHERPDLVASVVTYATPHGGTPVADVALGLMADPLAQQIVDGLVGLAGMALWDEAGNETALSEPMKLFSKPGIAAFNAAYPDQPGIYYASLTGRTDLNPGGPHCLPDVELPFIGAFAGEYDTVDLMFEPTEMLLDGGFGDPYPNDGLVRVIDARWGEFWGCVPADHLDEIGQLFGDVPGIGNGWKYKDLFSAIAAHLHSKGF